VSDPLPLSKIKRRTKHVEVLVEVSSDAGSIPAASTVIDCKPVTYASRWLSRSHKVPDRVENAEISRVIKNITPGSNRVRGSYAKRCGYLLDGILVGSGCTTF
jgi:hypothetical protein